jgi:excisionase family DNA binding protein
MSKPAVEKSFCTTSEAAELLGVSVGTVQLWVEGGVLQAWKTAGGHRRVMRDSVEALIRKIPSTVDGAPTLAPPKAVTSDKPDPSPSRRLTVLVVEDDVHLLRLYETKISAWPMKPLVIAVNSAVAGLVIMGRSSPDMLITDLHMPGMDGFEMLRVLSRIPETRHTKMVAVSGLDRQAIEDRGGLPPDIELLPKPIPFDSLLDIANVAVTLSQYRLQPLASAPQTD